MTYATARRRLLDAASWNQWAARRGYSPDAAAARKRNQGELATLRRERIAS